MNRFENINPTILFMYFLAALIPVMFITDYGLCCCAIICGIIYYITLKKRFPWQFLGMMCLMILVMVVVNALIVPGERVLFYLADRQITIEGVRAGVTTGLMLTAVLLWYMCFNAVFSADRIIRALRHLPRTALLISMILKLVPEFIARYKKVAMVNRTTGRKGFIKVTGAVFTWALERSMDTADVMTMRGYDGTQKFQKESFGIEEIMLLIAIVVFAVGVIINPMTRIIVSAGYYLIPVIYLGKENIRWAIYESKNLTHK